MIPNILKMAAFSYLGSFGLYMTALSYLVSFFLFSLILFLAIYSSPSFLQGSNLALIAEARGMEEQDRKRGLVSEF